MKMQETGMRWAVWWWTCDVLGIAPAAGGRVGTASEGSERVAGVYAWRPWGCGAGVGTLSSSS